MVEEPPRGSYTIKYVLMYAWSGGVSMETNFSGTQWTVCNYYNNTGVCIMVLLISRGLTVHETVVGGKVIDRQLTYFSFQLR